MYSWLQPRQHCQRQVYRLLFHTLSDAHVLPASMFPRSVRCVIADLAGTSRDYRCVDDIWRGKEYIGISCVCFSSLCGSSEVGILGHFRVTQSFHVINRYPKPICHLKFSHFHCDAKYHAFSDCKSSNSLFRCKVKFSLRFSRDLNRPCVPPSAS